MTTLETEKPLSQLGIAKPTEPMRELGRVRIPNPGSINYPLRALQTVSQRRVSAWKSKRWQMGNGLEFQSQGNTSRCVEFGNTHLLMLEPIVRRDAFEVAKGLYEWAQDNDPWPGSEPTYYGTSVDAGLQFLLRKAELISAYHWATSMDDVLARLSAPAKTGGGPLVIGVDWYSDMDNRTGGTALERHPTGWLRGGHCLDIIGHYVPTAKRPGRILYGNSHVENFFFTMTYDESEWLLFSQGGEAAAVTEVPRPRK